MEQEPGSTDCPLVWSEVNTLKDQSAELQTLPEIYAASRARGNHCEFVNTQTGCRVEASDMFIKAEAYAKGFLSLGMKAGDVIALCGVSSIENIPLLAASTMLGIGFAHPYVYQVNIKHQLTMLAPNLIVLGEGKGGKDFDQILTFIQPAQGQSSLFGDEIPSAKHVIYDNTYRDRQPSEGYGFQPISRLSELGQSVSDEELQEAISLVQPEHPAFHLFTSGSTGHPKCVEYSQRAVAHDVQRFPVGLTIGPVAHMSSNVDEFTGYLPLIVALCGSISKIVSLKDVMEYVDCLSTFGDAMKDAFLQEEVEHCMLNGPCQRQLISQARKHRVKFPSLKTALVGGQLISKQFKDDILEHLGAISWTGYGMSEISMAAYPPITGDSERDKFERREGRLRAKQNCQFKIVNESGAVVKVGEEGELLYKSVCMLTRYKGDPEETRKLFTEDGFLHTGDTAVMYPDSTFIIKGRQSDAIRFKVFAETVYPDPIEQIFSRHPSIQIISVVSASMNDWLGDEICYCIQLREGNAELTEEQVIAYCTENGIDEIKLPARVFYLDQIPHTDNMRKVSKSKLREYVNKKIQEDADAGITGWFRKMRDNFDE